MMKLSSYHNNFTTTDRMIRSILLDQLRANYNPSETAIIPEFTLRNGSARIDIAVVNGIIHGYELKSDFDNLKRLEKQIEAYNLIFDKITLVVGKKHIVDVLPLIPDWWGITIAKITNNHQCLLLLQIRAAKKNPAQDMNSIVDLLWKNEAIDLLRQHANLVKVEHMKKEIICNKLVKMLNKEYLKDYVRSNLVKRFINSNWRSV